MTDFASRISGIAMLALASLPIAALATNAHADTRFQVSDLNVLTPEGAATYQQRGEAAARQFCRGQTGVVAYRACLKGARLEVSEKFTALRSAKLETAGRSFAAR